jgi:hypothetical protein
LKIHIKLIRTSIFFDIIKTKNTKKTNNTLREREKGKDKYTYNKGKLVHPVFSYHRQYFKKRRKKTRIDSSLKYK